MNLVHFASVVGVSCLLGAAACSSTPAASDAGADASTTPTDGATPATDGATPPTDGATPPVDAAIPDAPPPVDAGADAPVQITCSGVDAGAQCNTVVNGAAIVPLVADTGALPTGTGGSVADGRYYLTLLTSYPGSALRTDLVLRQTLELCGGARTGQLVNDENGATKRKTFSFTQAGIVPNITQTCQSQADDPNIPYVSYTATATTLTFYSAAPYLFSATYTKQ